MKKFRSACLIFILASSFSIAGCGGSGDTSSTSGSGAAVSAGATSTSVATTPLSIASLTPTPGTYSTIPTTIQVAFTEDNLSSIVMSPSYWTMSCGSQTAVYATSVTFNNTTGIATAYFPSSVSSQTSGTSCTLSVSSSLTDTSGNPISGTLSYSYANGGTTAAGASGGVYNPANNSFSVTQMTYTYVGGSAFSTYAPGYVSQSNPGQFSLVGLNVRAGNYIDQIQPIWMPNYIANATGQILGSTYGGSGGSQTSLMCPIAGQLNSGGSGVLVNPGTSSSNDYYHVTGVYGTYDGYEIDTLGLICGAQDGSSTTSDYVSTAGGTGYYSFQLQCPAGTFVVAMGGYTGSYLEAIQLGCQ